LFFASRRRHTRCYRDWSSDVCSSDLGGQPIFSAPSDVFRSESPAGRPTRKATQIGRHRKVLKKLAAPQGFEPRCADPESFHRLRSEERRVGEHDKTANCSDTIVDITH